MPMRIRFSFLILVFFAASLHVRPLPLQAQEDVAGDTATSGPRRWYPRYVTFLPPSQVDSVLHYSCTDLVPVVYEVNKYTLHPTAQTDSIARLVKRIRDDYRVRLAYVWVGGSASPEGPVEWNRRLGDYRSRALAGYLQEHALLPDSLLRVENLAEDWESVACALRDEEAFPHREDILRILATEPDYAARKQQIQALDGGRTWTRLVRRVFPPFRNSRMVIVCYDQPPVPPIVRYRAPGVSTLPGKLSYAGPVAQEGPSAGRAVLLKSNVLAIAAAAVANVGFEVELWPRWSLDVPVYYSPYDLFKETRKVRLLATQPEVRYWFSRVADRHFVGLHTHVAGFNIALGGKGRYQDPGHALWGMGVSYGYALPFGKGGRWGAEFTLGVGFADYKYDKYENTGIRAGQKVYASGDKLYWGVTRAAISLSYKWNIKRKQRRTAL